MEPLENLEIYEQLIYEEMFSIRCPQCKIELTFTFNKKEKDDNKHNSEGIQFNRYGFLCADCTLIENQKVRVIDEAEIQLGRKYKEIRREIKARLAKERGLKIQTPINKKTWTSRRKNPVI